MSCKLATFIKFLDLLIAGWQYYFYDKLLYTRVSKSICLPQYIILKRLMLACGLFGFYITEAQDINSKIEKFAVNFGPEKAYLHYDKSTYSPGETVWFKAYLLNEIEPVLDSKTFYTDWYDDNGKLLQHSVSPLINGMTNGQYELPPDYTGRALLVKAYTSWMLNFDSSFLYTKRIPILSTTSTAVTVAAAPPTLDFFPEGGDAIAGIKNKIAFKATDTYGKPVKLIGKVVDETGKFIDSLKVIHDGMGYIMLTPKAGSLYTAKWRDEKKQEYTTPLPAIKNEGLGMQVDLLPGKRSFEITASPGLAASLDSIHVIGTMFQHPVFTVTKSIKSEPVSSTVPIQNLPYGILTITVFDKSWKPLAERITYINNNAAAIEKASMEVQHWGLSHRARNELLISLPDSIPASLSIAVTDLAISGDSSENILSSLMLTGDLKGKVNNPAFYFKDTSIATLKKMDLVMLTNGWRRFNWGKIIAGELPPIKFPKDTSYISLSGKLSGVSSSSIGPASAIIVMMKQKENDQKVLMLPINKDGSFNDPSVIFFDTARLYYQIQDKSLQGAMVQFMPNKMRVPDFGKPLSRALLSDTAGMAYHVRMALEMNAINERSKFKELENVTVAAKQKSPVEVMDEKYATGLFSGGDGIQLDVLHDQFAASSPDIFSYLQGKVAGLQISGSGANASLSWRGGAPQIYIDEMPADINFASSLNVTDVAYIKAFRPPFMGGFNGSNGAIAIYTKKGNDVPREPGKGLEGSKVEGYSIIKEFYVPKYYSQYVAPDAEKDLRTTIYWNPNVIIDTKKKQAIVSFYNNDVTDAFRVVIEGMTIDGRLIHHEENME